MAGFLIHPVVRRSVCKCNFLCEHNLVLANFKTCIWDRFCPTTPSIIYSGYWFRSSVQAIMRQS